MATARHSSCRAVNKMQRGLQKCWHSVQRWGTLISAAILISEKPGQRGLQDLLGQCRELVHLNLSYNDIGAAGTERLAGVLGQCAALAHLNLNGNKIGEEGAERLARVLGQCLPLAHLDFRGNDIGTVGKERLRASWRGQASGLVL